MRFKFKRAGVWETTVGHVVFKAHRINQGWNIWSIVKIGDGREHVRKIDRVRTLNDARAVLKRIVDEYNVSPWVTVGEAIQSAQSD